MQKQILLLTVLFTFVLGTGWASAGTTYTYSPYDRTYDYDGDYDDIRDLAHSQYYTWGINLNNPDDNENRYDFSSTVPEITSASFTFTQIYDYSLSDDSTLYVNLLDDELADDEPAVGSGHYNPINMDSTFADVDGWYDTYSNSLNGSSSSGNEFENYGESLIAATDIPHKTNLNQTVTPIDLEYTFDTQDLVALNDYVSNGFFGFGFDSDCHFYNQGFTFTFTTSDNHNPTPEPSTMVLFGFGMLCVASRMRKMAQK